MNSRHIAYSFHSFRQGRKSKEGWYLSRFPTIKFDVTQWRSFWVVLPFYTFWVRYVWVNTLSVKLHRAQLWNVIINLTRGDIEVDGQLLSKTKSFLFRVVVWSRRTRNPLRKFSLKPFSFVSLILLRYFGCQVCFSANAKLNWKYVSLFFSANSYWKGWYKEPGVVNVET